MPIACRCFRCGIINEAPDNQAGQTLRCSGCGVELALPGSGEVAAARIADRPHRGGAGRWWPWLLVIVVLLVCGAIATPIVSLILMTLNMSREHQRQYTCRSHIRNIASAMLAYEREHGALPPQSVPGPNGKPWHSWRVLLLPYLDEKPLYERYRFDEPWDGPHNRLLHDHAFSVYHCPTDDSDLSRTSYFVVSGPGMMFEPGKRLKSADAADGAGNTVLVIEAAGQNIHWLEPRDLESAQLANQVNASGQPSISSAHPKVAHVALVDESERAIADDADPAAVRAMLTRNGGETAPLPGDSRP